MTIPTPQPWSVNVAVAGSIVVADRYRAVRARARRVLLRVLRLPRHEAFLARSAMVFRPYLLAVSDVTTMASRSSACA